MILLDTITSSPLNVIFTIVIGIGLVYFYYRKPSSSSSTNTSSSSTSSQSLHSATSRTISNSSFARAAHLGLSGGSGGIINEELQRTIAQIERQERDMIRQEQDEAYQQSLRADREKQLKKEEESRIKEAEEKAERERLERLEQLHSRLIKLKSEINDKLPIEPGHDHKDIVKLVFKLPDGTRVKRNFQLNDKVKYLYWYVFSLNNAPLQFKMTTNFPKRDLPGRPPIPEDFIEATTCNNETTPLVKNYNNNNENNSSSNEPNCEQTLEEASLTETQIIFVYDLEA